MRSQSSQLFELLVLDFVFDFAFACATKSSRPEVPSGVEALTEAVPVPGVEALTEAVPVPGVEALTEAVA